MVMIRWRNNHCAPVSVIISSMPGISIALLLLLLLAGSLQPARAQCWGSHLAHSSHNTVALPEGVRVPELSLSLSRNKVLGFSLHINLRNFKLESPAYAIAQCEGLVHGYAYLFINGKKVKRLYGPYEYLPEHYFCSGGNEIKVTLYRYDHMIWTIDKEPLSATLKVDIDMDDPVISSESTSPVIERDEG